MLSDIRNSALVLTFLSLFFTSSSASTTFMSLSTLRKR